MPKIISISIRDEDEAIIEELAKLPGSRSSHIVEACRAYLKDKLVEKDRPSWYVEGKDYSYLPLETRQLLAKHGYKERCKDCGREITVGAECNHGM